MLKERYLTFLHEKHRFAYNENYKNYKLKDKLLKHFKDRIKFWRSDSSMSTSELVYSANIEGSAVEVAFELASSDEKRLAESAMILRRYVYEAEQNSPLMPWPPSAEWLLSDQRIPPTILSNFIAQLISGKSPKSATDKIRRAAKSISEDICYAVTNGSWAMPKHLLLPMTVRHITGNAELIALLNRLGHGQSYTKTMELEQSFSNMRPHSSKIVSHTFCRF